MFGKELWRCWICFRKVYGGVGSTLERVREVLDML